MHWEQLSGGALRFRGRDAVAAVVGLIRGDPAYHYSFGPWHGSWVDVYPRDVEAQNLLINLVEKEITVD